MGDEAIRGHCSWQGARPKEIGRVAMARVTPHVAQNANQSPLGYRPSHHPPLRLQDQSAEAQKRVEEPFGWGKTVGGLARPMLRGVKLDFSSR